MVASTIAQLFGQSPIRPLQEHMSSCLNAAQGLTVLFKASFNADWPAVEESYLNISGFENKADNEKKDIRMHLPRSLFMPIARNDLLTMLSLQDRVANCAKDIAGLLFGRKLVFPEAMQQSMLMFVQAAVAVVFEARVLIDELDQLMISGFSGSELSVVEKLIHGLDQLESEADGLEVALRNELMLLEAQLPPIDVMFMYKLIELVGNLADRAQKVGDHVHIIVAR